MIRNIWSILCSKSITDIQSRSITLVEISEELSIFFGQDEEPLNVLVNFELVTYWEREFEDKPEKGNFRVCLGFPGNIPETEVRNPEIYPIDLTESPRARVVMKIPTIPVFQPGVHRFKVEVQNDDQNWEQVANIPILINEFNTEVIPGDPDIIESE